MDTPLDRLAEQFRRLPGIGIKTARKLAYYMVQQPPEKVEEFIAAIRDAKQKMCFCSICFNTLLWLFSLYDQCDAIPFSAIAFIS